ncbi:chymotrypsin-2-like isoform X2 [Episyrphus balteatus]|nr:chymotrypsin-2-like isoform X2 [Episyrphus balteatus]
MLTVPLDYEIVADCSLSIPKGKTSCSTDFFFISRDGDQSLNGAEQICGSGNITRVSEFNKIVIAYSSSANSRGGRFSCNLSTRVKACDCGWSSQTRIIGGTAAKQYEYPSIVSLWQKRTQQHVCGGTIIHRRYIATAAHCTLFLEDPQNILIQAGFNATEKTVQFTRIYEAEEFINHPNYNWLTSYNDISLIKTKTPIEWAWHIGPICLPINQEYNNFDFEPVDIVGWGTTSFAGSLSKNLQTATVYVVPYNDCQTQIPFVQHSELCTYLQGKDSCQRDSGGPVVSKGYTRQYLLGIISRGNACGSGPGINTRTTSYLEWIYHVIEGSLCYKPLKKN